MVKIVLFFFFSHLFVFLIGVALGALTKKTEEEVENENVNGSLVKGRRVDTFPKIEIETPDGVLKDFSTQAGDILRMHDCLNCNQTYFIDPEIDVYFCESCGKFSRVKKSENSETKK
jgi:hypothetical protein